MVAQVPGHVAAHIVPHPAGIPRRPVQQPLHPVRRLLPGRLRQHFPIAHRVPATLISSSRVVRARGPLFLSESRRNLAEPLSAARRRRYSDSSTPVGVEYGTIRSRRVLVEIVSAR